MATTVVDSAVAALGFKSEYVNHECHDTTTAPPLSVLEQLTLEEKVSLLSGTDFVSSAAVNRLNVPALKIVDSINGVKGSDHFNGISTLCFPSTTCLGATWNPALLRRMGSALGKQAKAKAAQVILGPTMNLHRDPRAGRNHECFSEDPLLIGELAAAIVEGIQEEGVAACPKHFVANDSETKRRFYSVEESVDSRTLREIYMAAFQVLLRKSDPMAIMTAYNKVDGIFCSENAPLLNVLREEWGWNGCLMSDWFGTRSGPASINAGLTLEMPGPSVFRGAKLVEEVKNGIVKREVIDKQVAHILRLIEKTKKSHSSEPERSLFDEEANNLAREIAAEGIVLLQNRKSVLPLKKSGKLAVVGIPAIIPNVTGGGSVSVPPQYIQKPLDTIRQGHSQPELVQFAPGVTIHNVLPPMPTQRIFAKNGENGIDVRYFNDSTQDPIIEEFQSSPQVMMFGRLKPGLTENGFHYELSTTLIAKATGLHSFGVQATGSFVLQINGKDVLSKEISGISVEDFLFSPQKLERTCTVNLTNGNPYFIKLIVQPHQPASNTGEPCAHGAKLCLLDPDTTQEAIDEAVAISSSAEATIIFAGRTKEFESEGFDMPDLKLPRNQVEMIKAVSTASRRSIVVLNCGNPIDVSDFIDDVDAIICAHFPGQEGPAALADIIYGDVCPSGKLSVTWPKRLEDVPSFAHFPAVETPRGYELSYAEGLNVGYRATSSPSPQWAFGFGLSYTSFSLSSLSVTRSSSTLNLTLTVTNTGAVTGSEVIQAYIKVSGTSSVLRPAKELKAFTKVHLAAGESRVVSLEMEEKYAFGFWDESKRSWKTEKGKYDILVGELVQTVMLQEDEYWNGL